MGHIAHKANQNEMLNTLLCINAYNGTILWKRPTPPGFMIHRNTMVATADALYMGDDKSCKIIDGQTGKVRDEIQFDQTISDGPVWKWMAIQDGVLYGLVGSVEVQVDTQRSARRGLGHWPWGMWQGHDYKDPKQAFGFGRTVVAIDLKTKKPLWHFRDKNFLDARATCMSDGRIYCYSPQHFLACLDAKTGDLLWKNSDKDLLEAIGADGRAQHYITGYATTCYMKCYKDYPFFAGPQRERTVAASAKDGKLAWTYPTGNLQLVLRDEAVWAAGPQNSENGVRLDYETGKVLAKFPARRACTRATGCADSIFFRASGGTVRVLTETNTAQHIDPMRPPCQDGVLISNGHLYWGPWMCGCQLSLYGNIGLSPTQDALPSGSKLYTDALVTYANGENIPSLGLQQNEWVSYRGDNARSDATMIALPDNVKLLWETEQNTKTLPTAPVVAGGMVFRADRSGAIRAWNQAGDLVWETFAGGPIYYPPTIAHDRLFVGSADGRIYAFVAKTGERLWSFRVAPKDY
ncbi:MAG: PQQ-binding-like beta-propeller repeat protein, partial [Planctomycetaceae bacterium]|nr:PQQ-binding-like beta-propeller repeat protein [Planctomycetaceae bacterium]